MQINLQILEACPLFNGITPHNLSAILGCLGAKLKDYRKGETIFLEGESAKYVGVLLTGAASIIKYDYFGRRSIVANIAPPQLFGESFACAATEHLPVSVEASEQSSVLLIDCSRITRTCTNACAFHSQLILNLLRVVAEKNLLFNQKIEIMSRRTTREKLMAYLLDQAKRNQSEEFSIPFDRQELADYLGAERSALSAEISKLRNEGILESNKNRFHLLKSDVFHG